MGKGVTHTEFQIVMVPCPTERRPMLRAGIAELFDWLEELGDVPQAQAGQINPERICDEPCNS